ncbi:MAG: hypothetical protein HC880_16200, partial [Bacteroidia bacterium]|nr:hypothetical protein [Bacteroidia bacterium]
MALIFIGGLIAASYFLVQRALHEKTDDARTIHMVGRMEVLTQKILNTALRMQQESNLDALKTYQLDIRENLLALWQRYYQGLRHGDPLLGLTGNNSTIIQALFEESEPHYQAIHQASLQLIRLNLIPDVANQIIINRSVQRLIRHEETFSNITKDIALQYEQEMNTQLDNLLTLQIYLLGIILMVLLLVGMFVFRPMNQMVLSYLGEIQRSHSQLEQFNRELKKSEEENRHKTDELRASEEELRQNMEELQATQEVLALQKDALDLHNKKMIHSINYALTIQNAIMPQHGCFEKVA